MSWCSVRLSSNSCTRSNSGALIAGSLDDMNINVITVGALIVVGVLYLLRRRARLNKED